MTAICWNAVVVFVGAWLSVTVTLVGFVVTADASLDVYALCHGDGAHHHPDLVRSLPGYPAVQPPSCWYSGYLHYELAGQQVHTHYTLQTAELLDDDVNDTSSGTSSSSKPLIYWSSYVQIFFLIDRS